MRKKLSVLLSLLLFFSVIGASLHHHDDGFVHHGCHVCKFSSSYHVSTGHESPGQAAYSSSSPLLPEETAQAPFIPVTGFSSRAPPV